MSKRRAASLVILLFLLQFFHGSTSFAQWQPQVSGTSERLRGISAADDNVVWASGNHGTVLRTVDGGRNWEKKEVPGSEKLDFRDVQAISSDMAYVLSIGPGDSSRIYKTIDGGKNWALQFTNKNPAAFFDCLAFWNAKHGIALSDPVNGHFLVVVTSDGEHWKETPSTKIPPSLENEGAFAASGSCIAVEGRSNVWFASGGARVSRVFRSSNRGKSWKVSETPVAAGNPSSGIFSLAFHDARNGIALGGDYKNPDHGGAIAATTTDRGKTWKLTTAQPSGYRSGAAYVCQHDYFAVGISGAEEGFDGGRYWSLSKLGAGYNAVSFEKGRSGWAVGDEGHIAYAPNLCATVDTNVLAHTKH